MSEKTGQALSQVRYRIDLEEGRHVISQWANKEWRFVAEHKKFRDAVKALNELRGVKK